MHEKMYRCTFFFPHSTCPLHSFHVDTQTTHGQTSWSNLMVNICLGHCLCCVCCLYVLYMLYMLAIKRQHHTQAVTMMHEVECLIDLCDSGEILLSGESLLRGNLLVVGNCFPVGKYFRVEKTLHTTAPTHPAPHTTPHTTLTHLVKWHMVCDVCIKLCVT